MILLHASKRNYINLIKGSPQEQNITVEHFKMTPGPMLGSKLTPGTILRDYFQEPLVRLTVKQDSGNRIP